MLRELSIRDIAIIPAVELTFGPGLNVLSGETGAGKSLVVGGLRLLCGEKPPPDFVREGEERGAVEAVFELDPKGWIAKRLAEIGIDVEDGELILRREIAAEGKGRIRANGQAIPVRLLAQASELLVDLHGQHDHQSLLRPSWQLEALDDFADLAETRERFATELEALRDARAELDDELTATQDDRERAELKRFQREELDRAAPKRGELSELLAERGRLERAAQLREAAAHVVDELVESDTSVRDALARLARSAADAARHDPAWEPLREALDALAVAADEAGNDARRRLEEAVEDPERLGWVRERVRLLEDLLHKYGPEEAMHAYWEKLRADDADPAARDRRLAGLRDREAAISARLRDFGGQLTKRRTSAAKRLVRAVADALEELGMPGARFEAQLARRDAGVDVGEGRLAGPSGFDAAELLLAPNRGGRLLPLRSAASGGELSRVMLALKSVLGESRGTATMVFDEIDHGIGGLVAGRVARRLEELATTRQILCITHLPQIASRASVHFAVRKEDDASATVTTVERVAGESRVQEIARMLGAEEGRGAAVEHARELLAGDRT